MGKIAVVDSGKYATKAIVENENGEKETLYFPTKMEETLETVATGQSYVICYKGKRYLIGNGAEGRDFDTSKAKEIHRLATYTALANLVEDGDVIDTLVIGCPLLIFQSVPNRIEYGEFMLDAEGEGIDLNNCNKQIKIEIQGNMKSFVIKSLKIAPEGSGILFLNPEKYQKLVAIVDIGGLNANGCIYDDFEMIKSSLFTTNHGANILMHEIAQAINSRFPEGNLKEYHIEEAMKQGTLYVRSHPEESGRIFQIIMQKHLNGIIQEMKKKQWDLVNTPFIFVGGGSKLLEKQIKKSIPHAEISEDAIWDNAEGFLKFAKINS